MLSITQWSPTACEICGQFVHVCNKAPHPRQRNDCLNPLYLPALCNLSQGLFSSSTGRSVWELRCCRTNGCSTHTLERGNAQIAPQRAGTHPGTRSLKVVANQSGVVFVLRKGAKWGARMRAGRGFHHEHPRGQRARRKSCHAFSLLFGFTPTGLPPTHPFISPLLTFSIPSLFPLPCLIPRSLLTSFHTS